MSRPPKSEPVSLDDTRRARRATLFLAARMSAGKGHSPKGIACAIPGLKHFPGPKLDIAVAAGALPAEREILAWVRNRQTTCMIGRLSGRGDSLRLVVDIYLADGGIVALTEYRLLFSEDGRQWLVGGTSALVALQLSREGPIPTLTPPFADKIEFVRGTAKADDLLAAFLEG